MSIVNKLDSAAARGTIIPNWRDFWRFHSVRWNAAGALLSLGQSVVLAAGAIPFRDILGDLAMWVIAFGVFVASMIGRLLKQQDAD